MLTNKNKASCHILLNDENGNQKEIISIFGIDVSGFSRLFQFAIATFGLFAFYIIYGYFQEKIFLIPGFKPYGWYLTWFQFIVYSILGFSEMKIFKIERKEVPIKTYVLIAFLTVCTMGFSNASVGYLNYPTQVIFKCCKLIPTMIGGILIQQIRYNKLDTASVFMMVIGLIWFTLADNSVQPHFNIYGILLISMALIADGAIGNVQEKAMKRYLISSSEMVFYSYTIGLAFISIGLLASGQFPRAINICSKEPLYIYGNFFLFSVSGYFGIQFVLFLVKHFGALPAVTVTTCRKATTIALSFIFFQKPFTMSYVYSGTIVIIAIYLNLYSKNRERWQPKINSLIAYFLHEILSRRKSVEEIVV